jgi:hypothetical protein
MKSLHDIDWDTLKVGYLIYSSYKLRIGVLTSIKKKINGSRVSVTWSGGRTNSYKKESTRDLVCIGSSGLVGVRLTPLNTIKVGDLVCSSVRSGGHIATVQTIDDTDNILILKYDCYDSNLSVPVSECSDLYYLGKPPTTSPELAS